MRKPQILLVDDDETLLALLAEGLSRCFEILIASDITNATQLITSHQIDGMIIDVGLKQEDGLQFCCWLRQHPVTRHIPIFIMTGMGTRQILLSAYEVGADDYVEKPIDLEVLERRLLARLKRHKDLALKGKLIGNLTFVPERSEVELNGKIVRLTNIEIGILKLLVANLERNVSRDEISSCIWAATNVGDRTLDVHVSSLRRKLKGFDYRIESVYGVGYILRPPVASAFLE